MSAARPTIAIVASLPEKPHLVKLRTTPASPKTFHAASALAKYRMNLRRYIILAIVTLTSALGDTFLDVGMKELGPVSLHHLGTLIVALKVPWVLAGIVLLYALQRLQGLLPVNPNQLSPVSPDLSLNTAEGFLVNPPDLRSNTQRLFVPRTALESLTVLAVIGATRRKRRGIPSDAGQVPLFGE